jgi:hypothetical protein
MIPKSGNRFSEKIMPKNPPTAVEAAKAMRLRRDPCHKGACPRKRAAGRAVAGLPYGGGHAWDFAMAPSATSGKAGQRAARKARLAAALRENLKRRKQQARQRATDDAKPAAASSQDAGQDSEADIGTTGAAPDFRRNRNEE